MSTANPLPDGFHTKGLGDGNVEFVFVRDGNIIVKGAMTPEQVSVVASNLLNSARSAFSMADRKLDPSPNVKTPPIGVTRWMVAQPKNHAELAVIVESGEAAIPLTIPTGDVRAVARALLEASYRTNALSSYDYVQQALKDCASALSETSKVIWKRIKTSIRWKSAQAVAVASGRSLRIFKRIGIGSEFEAAKYAAVGSCIYCNSKAYSSRPGIRTHPLGAEHIVPEGIGGMLELPQASCQKHEDITGRLVEGDVLGRTLKAFRAHLQLKKKGSGPHPKSLPLDAKIDGKEQRIDIPIEDYPIIFMMLHFPPPSFVPSNTSPGRVVDGIIAATLRYDQRLLYQKYRISGFSNAPWDSQMFSRMLAKIGHSLAAAEIGVAAFRPLLLDFIRDGNVRAMNLIGGEPNDTPTPKSTALHELAIGYQRGKQVTYVVARIQLFARHGGPRYYVVVGESRESSIARTRRVFSSRISRMPAR